MIVNIVSAPKEFTAYDLHVTIENQGEQAVLLVALQHYHDRHSNQERREVLAPIIKAIQGAG